MASILEQPAVREVVLPISVEQYHRLGEAGIVPEQTELLRGFVVEQMIKTPLHTWMVQRLVDWLRDVVPAELHVRQEQPLTLADSEPEPDAAVVEGTREDYRRRHPSTARLVVEVAVATAELDRAKAELYATAAIPEYWLVLPEQRAVEVFRDPAGGSYRHVEGMASPGVLDAQTLPGAEIDLGTLFATEEE